MTTQSDTQPPAQPAGQHLAASFSTDQHLEVTGFDCDGQIWQDDLLLCALLGRPHWRDPQLAQRAHQLGDAATLAHAYRQLTDIQKVLDLLDGHFCWLLQDRQQRRIFAAIDRMGSYCLYFAQQNTLVHIATDARLISRHTGAKVHPQGVYNYVYFHMVPGPDSLFATIHKLQMAQLLELDSQTLRTRRYWLPDFTRSQASQAELAERLRHTLKAAVQRHIPAQGKTAAFLSGGLDSSTVAGMLAELSADPADAYAIGFAAQGYDEMPFARASARHFGIRLHEYYVTPDDVVAALPDIVASYPEPFGNSSALPAYFCARQAAADGVDCLLAGDGGDELFAGNARYAKQTIFQLYQQVPGPLRRYLIEPLVHHLPSALPLADKARSYVRQANMPLPGRMQSYNFLNQHAPDELFAEAMLAQVDTSLPEQSLNAVYHAPANATTLDRMLYLDWQFTLADNDLRKVSQTARLAGIEVAYPMLDDELVRLSCAIPDALKLRGQQLRYFYKSALTGWLSDTTINKTKQGFGLPFGVWMQTHQPLQQLAYDNLLSLQQRPFFKPEFIDKLIDLHRHGHAAYYGELIWILMVLELWLQQHPDLAPGELAV